MADDYDARVLLRGGFILCKYAPARRLPAHDFEEISRYASRDDRVSPVALTPARRRITSLIGGRLRENAARSDVAKVGISTPRPNIESDQTLRLARRDIVNHQLIY